jgi:hypothetical protein
VELDKLQKKTVLTADEQKLLISTTEQYVVSTLALAAANQTVSRTFDELLLKIPKLSSEYGSFKDILGGGASGPAIERLRLRLQKDILTGLGQGIYAGKTVTPDKFFREAAPETFTTALGTRGEQFDLADLIDNPELLRKLLPEEFGGVPRKYGGGQTPSIPFNPTAIAFLQEALQQEIALGDASHFTARELDKLTETILNLATETSTVTKEAAIVAQAQADTLYRQAIGTLSGEKLTNTILADTILERLQRVREEAQPNIPYSPAQREDRGGIAERARADFTTRNQALTETFNQIYALRAAGQAIPNEELIEAAVNTFKLADSTKGLNSLYEDLQSEGNDALNRGIVEWAKSAGLSTEQLNSLMKELNVTMIELESTVAEIQERFDAAIASAGKNFAQRSLQLEVSRSSGQFDENPERYRQLVAQNEQAYKSELRLTESVKNLDETAYAGLLDTLSRVIGLQHLNNLTSEEQTEIQQSLGIQLIENAVELGLNADQIAEVTNQFLILTDAITNLPEYKKIVVEIEQVYTTRGVREGGFSLSPDLQNQFTDASKKLAEEKKAAEDRLNRLLREGRLNRQPTTAPTTTNKPGLLDIPKEFIDQSTLESIRKGILTPETVAGLGFTDIKSLLQEAIKRARSLQSLVPGEDKANKNEIVELLSGTQRILETRGVGEEYLRKALEELTTQVKKQNDLLDKANTIRRIRVGAGDFAAFANVPLNTRTGVSVGGPEGPISINLNINGQLLTPAQFSQLADQIGAALKRQLAGG